MNTSDLYPEDASVGRWLGRIMAVTFFAWLLFLAWGAYVLFKD